MRRARNGGQLVGSPIPWPDAFLTPDVPNGAGCQGQLLSRHNGTFRRARSRRRSGSRRRVADQTEKAINPANSAAMVAVLVPGILMMTVGPTMLARTAAHCQPTFRGELRILPSHAGRGSRHVGNDVCTQTPRIRAACLPSRVVALSGRTVRVKSKRAGQQCKRARPMDITHVVTPAFKSDPEHVLM